MPRYRFTLTDEERAEVLRLVQKGGKGYRIKHAQVLLKLEESPENAEWTYDRIQAAYNASHATIAGVAQRFVNNGLEAALGRKKRDNMPVFITGEVEAGICAIACSEPPEGKCRWTMQMIADKLVQLGYVEEISDTSVCRVMKKTSFGRGLSKSGASLRQAQNL
jgi:hypothetical protein